MAVFAFILGSVIGMITAGIGLLGFGMGFATAFALYTTVSLCVGGFLVMAAMLTPPPSNAVCAPVMA